MKLNPKGIKNKKDKIFILVLVLTVGNLVWQLMSAIYSIANGEWKQMSIWLYVFADIIAVVGILWLLRSYRRSRKAKKDEEESK
jgi:heme/copper-type cytochrome/quinol oxidase subunit 2